MTSPCSHARLEAALAGELPAAEEAALQGHLDSCAACCAALEQLAGGAAWSREAAALLAGEDAYDRAAADRAPWSVVDFTAEYLEPADDPDVLGRLGGYDVLDVLGRGGMGVVLKGYDQELQRPVAIKVLAPHLVTSTLARQRFVREAQAAAAVVHPNVLAIHHVQAAGRLPFLVMPLVQGASLAERLAARGPMPLKDILRIGQQAAAGLAAAHDRGLVHRDVKPANLLLDDATGRAMLTDFGLACPAAGAGQSQWGVVVGTPQYMSPEQARGEPLDARSDLFSLGCVLYEMAAGVPPFRAATTLATLDALVKDPPPPLAPRRPDLPPWFGALVDCLLEKKPARRFRSAREVEAILEACLAHLRQPAAAPLPACLHTAARRGFSRRKGVWAMMGILGSVVLGIVLWPAAPGADPGPPAPSRAEPPQKGTKVMLQQAHHFATKDRVKTLAVSPDGSLIAVANANPTYPLAGGTPRTAQVLDAATGQGVVTVRLTDDAATALLAESHGMNHTEAGLLAFSPDGQVLAVGTGLGQVKLFNPRTGELLRALDDPRGKLAEKQTPQKLKALPRAMGGVGSLAFSPDGQLLATAGGSFEDVARGWGPIERLGLLTTGPGRLKVWEVATGALKHDLVGFSHANGVAFSPDGKLLASTGSWSGPDHGNGVILWDPQAGKKVRTIPAPANGGTHGIVFSPDGKLIAFSSIRFDKDNDTRASAISLVRAGTGIVEWQRTIPGWSQPKGFTPDGEGVAILCDHQAIRFLDAATGQDRGEIQAADAPPGGRWFDCVIAVQARKLFAGGEDGEKRGFVGGWNLTPPERR